jgi:cytochrome c biogenesis protein CcmG/thiol:disulfide interchange protein DsbE
MIRVVTAVVLTLLLMVIMAEAASPRIGGSVDAIRLPNLSGRIIDTSQARGKTVVLYFWNNLCGCTEQLIALNRFVSSQKGRQFVFITVNEGQSKAIVEGFIRDTKLPYEALLDSDLAVGKKHFGIRVLPTIFIIDKNGILREKLIGMVDTKKLESIIQRYF